MKNLSTSFKPNCLNLKFIVVDNKTNDFIILNFGIIHLLYPYYYEDYLATDIGVCEIEEMYMCNILSEAKVSYISIEEVIEDLFTHFG